MLVVLRIKGGLGRLRTLSCGVFVDGAALLGCLGDFGLCTYDGSSCGGEARLSLLYNRTNFDGVSLL